MLRQRKNLLLPVLLSVPFSAHAQFLPSTNVSHHEPIQNIEVKGNLTVSTAAILNLMTLKVGSPLNPQEISKDVKNIFASTYFQDVKINKGPNGSLIVFVVEKPTIGELLYEGFNTVSPSSFQEKISSKQYTIVDEKKLAQDLRTIEQSYIEKGYYLAKASYTLREVQPGTVDVIFQVSENTPITIRRVNLIGNEYFSDFELQSFMASRPYSWLSFLNSSGIFKDEYLQADQQNLTYFYRDNGFAEATVTTPVAYLNKSKTDVGISFYIEQGERFNVGSIEFTGDVLDTPEELKEQLSLKEGGLYRISQFNSDMKILKNIYGDKGYAFAYIYPSFKIDRETKIYNITYNITKGQKAYFRKIYTEGNVKTRDNVLRRAVKVYEGSLFNATNIDKSRAAIERLGFFESVEILQEPDAKNNTIDLHVIVKEKSTGSLSASLGASPSSSTASGVTFFGNFQYQEKNLFGKAYGVTANLQLSPGVQSASSFNYVIGLGFSNPSLYDGPWSFGVNGNYSYQETLVTNSSNIEEAFITTKSVSGGLNVGREIIEDLRFYLGYNVSFYHVIPSISLTKKFYPSGRTEEVVQTLVYDNTDNSIAPTSGIYASLANSLGIEAILGEYPYGKVAGNASFYYPITFTEGFKTNFRLTLQPQYVYQTNPNDSVPYWKRLTLGNTYFMKGYSGPGEQITPTIPVTISPVTGQMLDFNIGGDRSYYGALEYFLPVIPEAGLRFVAFGEAGAVLDDYEDFSPDLVKYDIGFGFRWTTPIAPFRFEWAFPMQNGKLGDAHFIFTIGYDTVGNM